MTVFAEQSTTNNEYRNKEYYGPNKPYNAYFALSGLGVFLVNITNFQYSWNQTTTGSSNSRLYQVTYPKRPEQSGLSVGLVFRDRQEYYDFGVWVRAYHVAAVTGTNPPILSFVCDEIGANYLVAITNLPMSFSWDMSPAPEIKNLSMVILRDMLDVNGSSTVLYGDENSMLGDVVGAWDIRGAGEGAFAKTSSVQKEPDSLFDSVYSAYSSV